MATPLRVLLIFGSEDDPGLVASELRRGGFSPAVTRAAEVSEVRAALAGGGFELLIAEHAPPGRGVAAALALARAAGASAPLIALSGAVGEEAAADAIRAGARDLVRRDRPGRLAEIAARELAAEAGARGGALFAAAALAAGAARELHGPLAALAAGVEGAARELFVEAAEPRLAARLAAIEAPLREVNAAGGRLRQLMNDLRLFSKPAENPGPLDALGVLEAAARMAGGALSRIRLRRAYAAIPPAVSDEGRLGRLFLCLLLAAAPPARRSGELRLSARREGARIRIELTAAPEPPGGAAAAEPGGVEPGLCLRLAAELGAELELEAGGCRLSLPAAEVEDAGPPGPLKILIVDDEERVGAALARLLTPEHEALALTSGREALLRLASGERFDVILCDVMMPPPAGWELYDELLRLAPEQAARVIFMTGGAFSPEARSLLARAPNPRLEKPFDIDALWRVIRRLCAP
jgi:CheY-like chemotaxis protein